MKALVVGTLRVPLNQTEKPRHGDRACYWDHPHAPFQSPHSFCVPTWPLRVCLRPVNPGAGAAHHPSRGFSATPPAKPPRERGPAPKPAHRPQPKPKIHYPSPPASIAMSCKGTDPLRIYLKTSRPSCWPGRGPEARKLCRADALIGHAVLPGFEIDSYHDGATP